MFLELPRKSSGIFRGHVYKLSTSVILNDIPANIYLIKVSNRNTRKMGRICSRFVVETSELRHRGRSDVFIINFEHISPLFLMFLFLNLNK